MLENHELDDRDLLDIFFYEGEEVRNIPKIRKEKVLENQVQKLLDHRLENPEGDLLDVLYAKRYRKEVLDILERMSHDYVDVVSCSDDTRVVRKVINRLAKNLNGLKAIDQELGVSWWSVCCYPTAPNIISHWPLVNGRYAVLIVQPLLYYGTPEVAKKMALDDIGITDSYSDSPENYKDYNFVSLLSFGGGDDDLVAQTGKRISLNRGTFRSKYVFIFFIDVPALCCTTSFQSLMNLCHELDSERDDVEMVMVARMNLLADTKQVFDHSFSGFPSSCLAVPYEDWERRENIWRRLDCYVGGNGVRCLVYNTDGLFSSSFIVDGKTFLYGAEAFPFTEEMLKKTDEEREQFHKDRMEKLLRPYESSPDVVVYELSPRKEHRRVSEVMKNKHVGVYRWTDGRLIPHLVEMYKRCKDKQQEFEIVVVFACAPWFSSEALEERLHSLLQEQEVACGWWCLPFNNSVSLRLWDLTTNYDISIAAYYSDSMYDDKLIIVGPDGRILDMYGADVINRRDGVDAYPFTRDAFVKQKVRRVREVVRLESQMWPAARLCRGDDPSDTISAATLLSSKKKIIVIAGWTGWWSADESFRRALAGWVSQYKEMKEEEERRDEFEVVFVEYHYSPGIVRYYNARYGQVPPEEYTGMPWYVHRLDLVFGDVPCTLLAVELTKLFKTHSLVGFGEDGCICSVKSLSLNDTPQLRLCLDESLYQDIYQLEDFDFLLED